VPFRKAQEMEDLIIPDRRSIRRIIKRRNKKMNNLMKK